MANETEELRLAILKEMRDVTIELANKNAEIKLAQGEIFKGREEELNILQSLREEAQSARDLLEGNLEIVQARAKAQLETLLETKEEKKLKGELNEAERLALEKKENQLQSILQLNEDQLKQMRQFNDEQTRSIGVTEKVIKHSERVGKELAGWTGVTSQWKDTLYGSFVEVIKVGGGLKSAGDMVRQLGKNAGAILENAIGSSVMKVQEATMGLAVETFNVQAGFEKSTSSGGQYADQIENLGTSFRSLGLGIAEAAAAFQSLEENLSRFRLMNKQTQDSLSLLVATLEKSGVNTATASKNLNFMMGALGKTAPEAEHLTRQLAGLADSLGVAASTITEDFGQAIKQLAHYGDRMENVFGKMKAAAMALNTDISTLLNFTEQFDEIASAGKAAASLNALMGAQVINPMEMMALDSADRMRFLVEQMHDSARAAELAANPRGVLAFARLSGIKDTSLALKVLQGDIQAFDEMQAKMKLVAKEEEAMAEQARRAMDTVKMLKVMMENFAIGIQPVVGFFHDIVVGIADFNDKNKGIIPIIVGVLAGFKLLMIGIRAYYAFGVIAAATQKTNILVAIAMRKKQAAVDTAASAKRIAEINAETAALQRQNVTQGAGGVGAVIDSAGMMAKAAVVAAYGVAMAGLGAAIYLTAEAFSTLAAAFKQFDAPTLLASAAAIGILAAGFFFMAKGLLASAAGGAAAAIPLATVGAAILMIGGGIFLAVYGFVLLGESGLKAAEAMLATSLAMGVLALTMKVMAVVSTAALVGFGMLAAGITLVGLALRTISTADLTALGNMFGGLGKVAAAGGVDLANMKNHIIELAELAEGMEGKAIGTYVEFANATEKFGFAGENITAPAMATRYATAAVSAAPAAASPAASTSPVIKQRGAGGVDGNSYKFYLSIGEEDFEPYIVDIIKNAGGG